MTTGLIWFAACAVYGVFSLWYNNFRAPLGDEEVDECLRLLKADPVGSFGPEQLEVLERFLRADDGREFYMLNLVRFHPGDVIEPGSGASKPAPRVLEGYTRPFVKALFKRAGHPVFGGRAVGSYVEHWGVEPDPGWSFGAVMRYRSRRDMIELVLDPTFAEVHVFKEAAMSNTAAFPISPAFVTFGPRITVALVLALVAAIAHLGMVS